MFSNRFIYRTFIGVITLMIAVCMSPPTMAQSGQPVCQISYAGSWVDNGIGFLEYGFSWHNTTPGTVTATFAMLDQVYVFNANESYEEIRLHASPNSRSIASLLVEAANGTCYATSEKIIPALPGNPEANPPMCQVSYHHGWLDNGSGHAEFGYSWHNTIQGTVSTRFNYLGQEVTYNDWEAYYQVYTPAGINTNPVGRITVISQNGSCIATGIAQVPDIPPLPQCPSGTGPGGITAGDYDSGSLTPEQRQWLWNIFGNNPNEQAPVGYGGQHCAGQQPVLPECPSGTGPGGIVAGDHDSSTLTQEQRNWLYWVFGNNPNEQAPVGYGGQPCNWTQPQISPCPAGVGEPGDFSFMSLTQQQRNELYWAFGHSGEAPVGYSGESCYGGTLTLPSFTGGSGGGSNPSPTSTPIPIPTQGGSNPNLVSIDLYFPTFNHTYHLEVSKTEPFCYIENGAEIVSDEIVRFNNWFSSVSIIGTPFALIDYMAENHSDLESLRESIEYTVSLYMNGCQEMLYMVGNRTMDTSGLGNIMFGYATSTWPDSVTIAVANWAQRLNEHTRSSITSQCAESLFCSFKLWVGTVDNADDQSQADTGERLAELTFYQQGVTLNSIPIATIIQASNESDLY